MGNRTSRTTLTFGLSALLGWSSPAGAGCSPGAVDLRWEGGQAHFTVEIADTDGERQIGLMNRDEMAAGHGMLFVYDRPHPVAFWMHNTRIPLDMLFFGPDGRTVSTHENARPMDDTAIAGGDEVQYVLEINGGLMRRLGMTGTVALRHPAIDSQLANWPCDGK